MPVIIQFKNTVGCPDQAAIIQDATPHNDGSMTALQAQQLAALVAGGGGGGTVFTQSPITGDGSLALPISLDETATFHWTGAHTFDNTVTFNATVNMADVVMSSLTISTGDLSTALFLTPNGINRSNATLLLGADLINVCPGMRIGSQATLIEINGVIADVLTFSIGTNHTIHVEDAINQGFGHDGGNLTIKAADGGPGQNPATNPGAAGTLFLTGAGGGEGTTLLAAKAGGSVQMIAGAGGQNNGGGGANGGGIVIDAGAASGAGVNGTMALGATNASAVSVGRTGIVTTLSGDWTVNGTQFGRPGTMKIYNDSNNGPVMTAGNILMRINDVTQVTIGSGTIGFYGGGAVAQPAHPANITDVIAALVSLGLVAP